MKIIWCPCTWESVSRRQTASEVPRLDFWQQHGQNCREAQEKKIFQEYSLSCCCQKSTIRKVCPKLQTGLYIGI